MYHEQGNETIIIEDLLSSLAEVDAFVKNCRQCVAEMEEVEFRLYYCILEPFEYLEGVLPASRRYLDGVLEGFANMLEEERVFWCGRQVGVALVSLNVYA